MDKSLMKENYMVTKNPGAVLFVFALPMIIGNLFQQFYNMVDTIIVGRFIGTQALAAVGASYAFTNVFIMIAIGGGIGASVLTSQYLGAEEYGKMRTSVFTADQCVSGTSGFCVKSAADAAVKNPAGCVFGRGFISPDLLCGHPFFIYVQCYYCNI